MSRKTLPDKRHFTVPPKELLRMDSIKTTRYTTDSLNSFPNSPTVSINLLSDFQGKIREKDHEIGKMAKKCQRIEFENAELLTFCMEKDSEIRRLIEENSSRKEKKFTDEYKDTSEYWRKEVVKKNDEIKKLQEKVRFFQSERGFYIEKEVMKLKEVFEMEKIEIEKKFEDLNAREKKLIGLVKSLQEENDKLKAEKGKIDEEYFQTQLSEIEALQNTLKEENVELKSQLEIIRKGNNLHDLAVLSPDIHQISYQIHQLLTILQNLRAGKEISISMLLNSSDTFPMSSSKQLIFDVISLKTDINLIKEIVSDCYAENMGLHICATQ